MAENSDQQWKDQQWIYAMNQCVTDECDSSWKNSDGIGVLVGYRNRGCSNVGGMTERVIL